MEKCPECESERVRTHSPFTQYVAYGIAPDTVTIVFEAPMLECSNCGLMYSNGGYESASEAALAKYRRAFRAVV